MYSCRGKVSSGKNLVARNLYIFPISPAFFPEQGYGAPTYLRAAKYYLQLIRVFVWRTYDPILRYINDLWDLCYG